MLIPASEIRAALAGKAGTRPDVKSRYAGRPGCCHSLIAVLVQALRRSRTKCTCGLFPGGDPDTDGPAVAAVHGMVNALDVPDGTWRAPAGTWEARYEVVTEMMQAMDGSWRMTVEAPAWPGRGRDRVCRPTAR